MRKNHRAEKDAIVAHYMANMSRRDIAIMDKGYMKFMKNYKGRKVSFNWFCEKCMAKWVDNSSLTFSETVDRMANA